MEHPSDNGSERRARLVQDITERTGIDEALIARLVRTFYGRVRKDPLIGPIFEARVADWDEHIDKLCAFWSSVTLMSGRYSGHPLRAHLRLPVDEAHFDRWVSLFEATAADVCPPAAAAYFVERARRIADSFEMGIAAGRGQIKEPRFSRR
jgi:hemoglobin